MAKIKRRPTSRKRHRKASERLFCIIAYATISVFVLIYIFSPDRETRTGHDEDVFTSTKASAARLSRCRSSCDELVLSKVSASSAPSTALATSAVDALFLLQDTHNESSTERRQATNESGRSGGQRKQHSGRKNNYLGDEKSMFRPIQLPPLIETLIGTVDEQNVYSERYARQSRKGTKKIIRKEGQKKLKGNATSAKRQQGDRSARETVQMAAAAAAAVVWSDPTRNWGRHRMRTLNEEWDAALRWIAGWGHQYETGHHFQDINRDPERGRNIQGQSVVSSYKMEKDGATEDFSLLFDTCVDECLENYVRRVRDDGSLSGGLIGIGRDIATKFISLFWGQTRTTGHVHFYESEPSIIATSAFRIVLSSLLAFCVRFLWRWWNCAPLSPYYLGESPQWLLEETGAELDSSRVSKGFSQRQNVGENKKKGCPTKKGKRRKKPRNPTQSREVAKKCTEGNDIKSIKSRPRCASDVESESNCVASRKDSSSWANHEEYESEKVSVVKNKGASSGASDSNGSLCTLSQCSEPRDLNCNEESQKQIIFGESSSPGNPSECFDCIHAGRTDTSDGLSSMASSYMTSATPSPILAPVEKNVLNPSDRSRRSVPEDSSDIIWHPRSPDLPEISMKITSNEKMPSVQRGSFHYMKLNQVDPHQNDPVVPTDEQREEASRQLREFQKMQIQRIVQRKAALASSGQGNNTYAALLHQKPVQGTITLFSQAPHSVSISPTRACNSVIGPPPKVTLLPTNNVGNEGFLGSNRPTELDPNVAGCLTDKELLLSGMLDEDDETETTKFTAPQTIPPGFGGNQTTRPCSFLPGETSPTSMRKQNTQYDKNSGAGVSADPWIPLQTSPLSQKNETQKPPTLSFDHAHSVGSGIEHIPDNGSPVRNVFSTSASRSSTWSSHESGTW